MSEVASSFLLSATGPDSLIDAAITAVQQRPDELQAVLEAMPAPIYLTDSEGWVTAYNRACIDFAGRTPVAGEDRWCVSWRLHTERGEPIRHDQCPMALAIQERRAVRGLIAVAERPDGTRVLFAPYPTPIFDEDGALTGAANILIDVTDRRQASLLRTEARRCRRLAQSITDTRTVDTLNLMASDYEEKARALDEPSLIRPL